MTSPFFILIWSSLLQKEIIALKYWIILIVGFMGTILIAKPTLFQTNLYIYLIFLVAAYNALTSVIVSKFSNKATALGFSFYNLLPLTVFCIILFIFDPIKLINKELIIICIGGTFSFFSKLFSQSCFSYIWKIYKNYKPPFFYTINLGVNSRQFFF